MTNISKLPVLTGQTFSVVTNADWVACIPVLVDGSLLDLTGISFEAHVVPVAGGDPVVVVSTANGLMINGGADGTLNIDVPTSPQIPPSPSSCTSLIPPGSYVMDVVATADGEQFNLFGSAPATVTVTAGVTASMLETSLPGDSGLVNLIDAAVASDLPAALGASNSAFLSWLASLPTSEPSTPGAWWNNGGVLTQVPTSSGSGGSGSGGSGSGGSGGSGGNTGPGNTTTSYGTTTITTNYGTLFTGTFVQPPFAPKSNVSFSLTFMVQGGHPPYLWTATGMPAGLVMNDFGFISGIPTQASGTSFNVLVTATDSEGNTATMSLIGPIQ